MMCLSGCTAMTADPWSWLDDPEQQRWVSVELVHENWQINLQVPDHGTIGIERMVSIPPLDRGAESMTIRIPENSIVDDVRMAYFQWDSWWGGFLKESGSDFRLDIWVYHYRGERNLLDLDIDERIERRIEQWEKEYSDPLMHNNSIQSNFFESYQINPHQSAQGLLWVVENSPATKDGAVSYMIPLSNTQILDIGFFVNQKRYDWKDDPEWNERRWALSRKILDTVTITRTP